MVYEALREVPARAGYREGDVLVLFGRGYANGIVDEARRAGMTIVGATVGRRDGDGSLRPLDAGELSLYPLLEALRAEGPGSPAADAVWGRCRALLRDGATVEALLAGAEEYLASPLMAPFRSLAAWPQHTTREQLEAMLAASEALLAMSADVKNPVCAELSRAVFHGVGRLMFDASWEPSAPVVWLNHDVVARRLIRSGHAA